MSRQQTADSRQKIQCWYARLLAVCCVLGAVCLVIGFPVPALACPLCKEALFSPGETASQAGLAQGYLVSIAALLGIPTVLVGGLVVLIVRSSRHTTKS